MTSRLPVLLYFLLLRCPVGLAQKNCPDHTLRGVVVDTTGALIPGVKLRLDESRMVRTAGDGSFAIACFTSSTHHLHATHVGFAEFEQELHSDAFTRPLRIILQPAVVEQAVEVVSGEDTDDAGSNASSLTLSGDRLTTLADDPDELLKNLQQLALLSGGKPADTVIAVDGFQDSTTLPAKSAIAYIKINPDRFSAEYAQAPFSGGRVEIYTRPGQKTFHGSAAVVESASWMNATNPFAISGVPLGKRRYAVDLSGPIRRSGSSFSFSAEQRGIDDSAVVRAVGLDTSGNQVALLQNIGTPQKFLTASARVDWQLSSRNSLYLSASSYSNTKQNQGVGGIVLKESAYDDHLSEQTVRTTLVTTVNALLMHETRMSLRWNGDSQSPASAAPHIVVSGAFEGGGSVLGAHRQREFHLEYDDDAIVALRKHTIKLGTQFLFNREAANLTDSFNGNFTFGGGSASVLDTSGQPVSGSTVTINGLEQYRRTLAGLAGGSPTTYSTVMGTPSVSLHTFSNALFVQDEWTVTTAFHVSYGLRYYMQSTPWVSNALVPRVGLQWTPDRAKRWSLHAHAGLFAGKVPDREILEVERLDGVHRFSTTVYKPVFSNPLGSGTQIETIRSFAPGFSVAWWSAENVGGTYQFPHGWRAAADVTLGRMWNLPRSPNINTPLNGAAAGPRPFAANLNWLQTQNSGQGRVDFESASVQKASNRFRLLLGITRVSDIDDTDDDPLFSPQNAYSDAGELARRSYESTWSVFGNGTLQLPAKLALSTFLDIESGHLYNVTTGMDNNADGNFNDRPQYASPGTNGSVTTPFGLLVAQGGNAVLPRNAGTMPWTVHLDGNLQRTFKLTRNPKAEHVQSVSLNVRSSNLLNHTNVTGVGGVLGSALFTKPYAADTGRRIEAGVRYSF